jgi:penicillin-binding protein 1A
MKKQGVIDGETYRTEVASPMTVTEYEATPALGGYFMETVRQFMEKRWNEDFVYNQGVKVWSTLDSGLQRVAESSLVANLHKTRLRIRYRTARNFDMPRHLKMPIDSVVRHWDTTYARFDSLFLRADTNSEKQRFPDSLRYVHAQAALILVENATGAVSALIGGDNFETTKYNRALQATRSPGSSFKPFVYAAAVDNGASPADMLSDQPITIPDPVDSTKVWRPHNFEPGFEGKVSMRRALYRSMNLPAIEVGMKYGLASIASYARRFGLEHSVPAVPSLSIGSCEATLLEMVSAYTAFPNGGVRTVPYMVNSILDKSGNEVFRHFPETHEVLRKETAWIMTTMLRDVNVRGTAAKVWASGFDWPSGGKTGTTNDYTDAWYVGYTNQYTCGVWVGADNHKGMGRGHTGSDDALPIWLDVMFAAMKGSKKVDFPRPSGVSQGTVCTVSGFLAQPFCDATNTDWFLSSAMPSESCSPEQHQRPIAEGDISTANRKAPIRTSGEGEKVDPRVRKTF